MKAAWHLGQTAAKFIKAAPATLKGMSSTLTIHINGQSRSFTALTSPALLSNLIEALELKADRIAVEHNTQIVARPLWEETRVRDGDRVEIVHFVGGGTLDIEG